MNIYLVVILTILIGEYLLSVIVEHLNVRHADLALPKEFENYYDAEKYKQSQNYLKERTNFSLFKETILLLIILTFILLGGFNSVDKLAGNFSSGPITRGLIFAAVLVLASQIINIPFSVYRTFVIETRYDFNRTTPKTFILDILKSLLLILIIGAVALSFILWFFEKSGKFAWLYCWLGVTLFQLFLTFIAPVLILPLFNKFTPLEEGELKTAIKDFARRENFKLKGIFKMDASRRSSKSNAFFTGLGKYKRIALFDTLMERYSVDELVSILAHEIGHYKKKHLIKEFALSTFTTGLMFFILSFFINNPQLSAAFKMDNTSIYASLFFFGFLYSPINMFFSLLGNFFSRKYEYEADFFAALRHKKPETFISALKKLTVENLSNLTPHPLKVFLHYRHPPVLKRIRAIGSIKIEE